MSSETKKLYTGILDFTYAPYALGDALTFVGNLQAEAEEAGATFFETATALISSQRTGIPSDGSAEPQRPGPMSR